MERAVRILSALFATAAAVFLIWLLFFAFTFVIPAFPQLRASPYQTTIVGLLMGYWTMFAMIYAALSRLLWQRKEWKRAMLFAALGCFGLPVGPVIGPLALIMLTRPRIRALFTA